MLKFLLHTFIFLLYPGSHFPDQYKQANSDPLKFLLIHNQLFATISIPVEAVSMLNSLDLYQYIRVTVCNKMLFMYSDVLSLSSCNAEHVKSLMSLKGEHWVLLIYLTFQLQGYTFPLHNKMGAIPDFCNTNQRGVYVCVCVCVWTFSPLSWFINLVAAFRLLQSASCLYPASSRELLWLGGAQARTFHLHEVELVDGLQQRAVVQTQVEVRGHPGSERAFPPLILSQVHSPYEGVRNLFKQRA